MGLKYSPLLKLKIYNQIHSGADIPAHGQSCIYIKLDSNSGAKLYWSARARNLAYKNQKLLHGMDLAPSAGDLFELPFLSMKQENNYGFKSKHLIWKNFYGYITQHAGRVNERKDYPKVKKFLDKISILGYDVDDLENDWNIGKIGDRIVCIDTDPRTLLKARK